MTVLAAAWLLAARWLVAEEASPAARVVAGELVRVDLWAHELVVRPEAKDQSEATLVFDDKTRFVARGRVLRIEDVRPGERVAALVTEEEGQARARLVRVGRRPAALPSPSASPR